MRELGILDFGFWIEKKDGKEHETAYCFPQSSILNPKSKIG